MNHPSGTSPVRLADFSVKWVLCLDQRHPAYFDEVKRQFIDRGHLCLAFLNGMPDGRISSRRYWQINNIPPPDGWTHGRGQWNHLRAFRGIIQESQTFAPPSFLFLEDDALFTPDADRIMAEAEVPDDWELLYLGAYHMWNETEEVGRHVLRLNGSPGSHAVAVRSTVFDAILSAPQDLPTDGLLATHIHPRGKSYCLFPPAVVQNQGSRRSPGSGRVIRRSLSTKGRTGRHTNHLSDRPGGIHAVQGGHSQQ